MVRLTVGGKQVKDEDWRHPPPPQPAAAAPPRAPAPADEPPRAANPEVPPWRAPVPRTPPVAAAAAAAAPRGLPPARPPQSEPSEYSHSEVDATAATSAARDLSTTAAGAASAAPPPSVCPTAPTADPGPDAPDEAEPGPDRPVVGMRVTFQQSVHFAGLVGKVAIVLSAPSNGMCWVEVLDVGDAMQFEHVPVDILEFDYVGRSVLHISGIDPGLQSKDVHSFFSKYGKVLHLTEKRNWNGRVNYILEYSDVRSARRAVWELDGIAVRGISEHRQPLQIHQHLTQAQFARTLGWHVGPAGDRPGLYRTVRKVGYTPPMPAKDNGQKPDVKAVIEPGQVIEVVRVYNQTSRKRIRGCIRTWPGMTLTIYDAATDMRFAVPEGDLLAPDHLRTGLTARPPRSGDQVTLKIPTEIEEFPLLYGEVVTILDEQDEGIIVERDNGSRSAPLRMRLFVFLDGAECIRPSQMASGGRRDLRRLEFPQALTEQMQHQHRLLTEEFHLQSAGDEQFDSKFLLHDVAAEAAKRPEALRLEPIGGTGWQAVTAWFVTIVPRTAAAELHLVEDGRAGTCCVADTREFERRFNRFTGDVLSNLPKGADGRWDGVAVYGGSVVAALLPGGEDRGQVEGDGWYDADVDVFLYGCSELADCQRRAEAVRTALAQAAGCEPSEVVAVYSDHTLMLAAGWPRRTVQIQRFAYRSMAHALSFCDIDCTASAWDGRRVVCSARALLAYSKRWTVLSQQSANVRGEQGYMERLKKYARRGFAAMDMYLDNVAVLNSREHLCQQLDQSAAAKTASVIAYPIGDGYGRNKRRKPRTVMNAGVCLQLLYETWQQQLRAAQGEERQADRSVDWQVLPYGPQWTREALERHVTEKLQWALRAMTSATADHNLTAYYQDHTHVTGKPMAEAFPSVLTPIAGANRQAGTGPPDSIYAGLECCRRYDSRGSWGGLLGLGGVDAGSKPGKGKGKGGGKGKGEGSWDDSIAPAVLRGEGQTYWRCRDCRTRNVSIATTCKQCRRARLREPGTYFAGSAAASDAAASEP